MGRASASSATGTGGQPPDRCANDLYDGETYDARLERAGWSEAGYDDRDWTGVEELAWDKATLFARWDHGAPHPAALTAGHLPVARGQDPGGFWPELVGRVRLTVRDRPGRRSSCGMPRCSSTAGRAPARCATPKPPTATSSKARGSRPETALHLSRLSLCRGERLVGRAAARAAASGGVSLGPGAHRLV